MKISVNKKSCNGCTICNITCPEVFLIEEDGKAAVLQGLPDTSHIQQICCEAADECPMNAIMIEEMVGV
jgi:ferredoxin